MGGDTSQVLGELKYLFVPQFRGEKIGVLFLDGFILLIVRSAFLLGGGRETGLRSLPRLSPILLVFR